MGKKSNPSFADRLLGWWDQHGRKNLPWQQPRSEYRVWISEIMLQQTQVSTVIPYFERWMRRFPDLCSLAAASLDEVLAHWAGLGYYARARNLHRAAQLCVSDHKATLPETLEQLRSLPGIGLSTANAILSQATDVPAAVLDGNVRRVLARHIALQVWPGSTVGQAKLWRIAERRLPASRGADYTQAIMDLGALLCTRSKPACPECPLQGDCRAYAQGSQNQLPLAKPATKVSKRNVYWLALLGGQPMGQTDGQPNEQANGLVNGIANGQANGQANGEASGEPNGMARILLEKRPPVGIWGGLWSLPEAASLAELEQVCGLDLSDAQLLPMRLHRLSHVAMSIHPVVLRSNHARQVVSSVKLAAEQVWFGLEAGQLPAIPQALAVLIEQLREAKPELGDRN